MAEIVNLRTVRKQRQRQEDSRRADENRVRFGRTKAERAAAEHAARQGERHLDGHRLSPAGERPGPNGKPDGAGDA